MTAHLRDSDDPRDASANAYDLSILRAVDQCADENGWAPPAGIADLLYGSERDGRAVMWPLKRLARDGLLEYGPAHTWSALYGLTEAGAELLEAADTISGQG